MTLIDNCNVEKLISAVKCRKPIYDNSAKEHGSRGVMEYLWNEIAEELNAPVNKCKAKWQQLRNSFVRSYRGTSGYGKKRKKWYLHDALSFMGEHIQLHKIDDTYSNDRSLDEDEIEEKAIVSEKLIDELSEATAVTTQPAYTSSYFQNSSKTTAANSQKSENNSYHLNCDSQETPVLPKLQPIPQMQSIPPKYINLPTNTTVAINTGAHNYSRGNTPALLLEDNPLLNFCKGIIPEYDMLSVERQRKFKTDILDCLNRHLDEQEKNKITINHNSHTNDEQYKINYVKQNSNTERNEELRKRFKLE